MDYCTIEDIETYVSTSTLIQLTSDYEQDEVDRVVAEEAIIYSSTLIDGYLRGRYTLPLDARFPLLRIVAIDLSVYRLYSRRMRDDMPEVVEANDNNAIKILQDLQQGAISLETENDTSISAQDAGYKTNKNYRDSIFRRVMYEY